MSTTTTGIEWCDRTWNPTRGCSRVSPGCQHCFAEAIAYRFSGPGKPFEGLARKVNGHPAWTGKVVTVESALREPLSWRKPCRVFVNSMSDLFHEDVPIAFIDKVFAVMALCERHTFQILTKRPARMREYLSDEEDDLFMRWGNAAGTFIDGDWIWNEGQRFRKRIELFIGHVHGVQTNEETGEEEMLAEDVYDFPLPNVWLGVSAEDQQRADERIPLLLQTPAAVRFVSAEPLLGPMNLCPWIHADWSPTLKWWKYSPVKAGPSIDWVIVGGESGPGARDCRPHWVRQIVEPCRVSQTTRVFVKQLGSRVIDRNDAGFLGEEPRDWPEIITIEDRVKDLTAQQWQGDPVRIHLKDRKGGDPSEWPEDLRVRQFPEVRP